MHTQKKLARRLIKWAILIVLLLLIPLVLTIRDGAVEGVGWNWTLFDFIFMGTLLFGCALTYELVARKMSNVVYRAAVGLAVTSGLLLVWINAAVGIIGHEDTPANLLYFGVLAIGAIGALIARFRPHGMARTLFAVAVGQLLVPFIILLKWKSAITSEPPGITRAFILNSFFVALWIGSAWLFLRASRATPAAESSPRTA
jgi:hypothetical protein